MLFDSHSIQFKIALIIIWAFPYLALGLLTRDWRLWVKSLFESVSSVLLFSLALILLGVLVFDFESLSKFGRLRHVLEQAVFILVVLFPGLLLVTVMGMLAVIFRPAFPNGLLMHAATALFHLLYLANIVLELFKLHLI
jgi:hypothetical protein